MHEFLISGRRIVREPLPEDDPYLGSVTLLMHMDGSPGSKVFTDSTGRNTFTPYGTARLSSDQYAFGESSALFESSSYIDAPYNTGYSFSTGDFTIEGYFYLRSLTGGGTGNINCILTCLGTNSDGGGQYRWAITVNPQGRLGLDNAPTDSSRQFNAGTPNGSIQPNVLYHFAFSRIAGTMYIFLNGISCPVSVTGSRPASSPVDGSGRLRIGRLFSTSTYSWTMNGYVDELRITKGVGRYKNSFYLPTKPFPNPA